MSLSVAGHMIGAESEDLSETSYLFQNDSSRLACALVDDDANVRRILVKSIGDLAAYIVECPDIAAFARLLETRTPDLVFLDISVGSSDAVEVLKLLRDRSFAGTIQLMSGRGRPLIEDINVIGTRYGLVMLPPLQKPFRAEAIRRIVRGEMIRLDGGEARIVSPAVLADRAAEASLSLSKALDAGDVEIWYQPKVRLVDGTIYGAEGLARIRLPDQSVAGPDRFLADADQATMDRLTEFALLSALRDSEDFLRLGFPIRLAINISAQSLRRLDIASLIRKHRPVDPDWPGMILELTEHQAVEDLGATQEIASQLRIHGVGLSIDDFGTAYSSLGNLTEELFEEVKLDRSYVFGCADNMRIAALSQTVVDLARRIGIAAVAEGVENRADRNALIQMGCKFGQGHFFSTAVPKATLLSLLRRVAIGS